GQNEPPGLLRAAGPADRRGLVVVVNHAERYGEAPFHLPFHDHPDLRKGSLAVAVAAPGQPQLAIPPGQGRAQPLVPGFALRSDSSRSGRAEPDAAPTRPTPPVRGRHSVPAARYAEQHEAVTRRPAAHQDEVLLSERLRGVEGPLDRGLEIRLARQSGRRVGE